jgi:pimeloyl-ACP methyl ester carboxylesterase
LMRLHQTAAIPGFNGSYGLISSDPSTRTAVIFVHGFWGNSYSTWQDFQILVDEYGERFPALAAADLFFFEYAAARNFVGPSADGLETFVRGLYPLPPECLFSEDIGQTDWGPAFPFRKLFIRRGPYRYDRLVFVGHSLGAVVIRQLVLDVATRFLESHSGASSTRCTGAEDPIVMAELCLISPAHLGFRAAGVLGAAFSLASKGGLVPAILSCYRSFVELDPNSAIIRSLRDRTEQLATTHPELRALRARILWAQYEDLVTMERYDCDPPASYANDKNHITVCKPLRGYLRPLEFVDARGLAHGQQ